MKIDRQALWKRYDGRCAYCGTEIAFKDMQADHIIPKYLDGSDSPDNLMPSCRLCNHYKRAHVLDAKYGFRNIIMTLHERIEKIYIVRVAIRYGLLTLKPFDGKFYFEKL